MYTRVHEHIKIIIRVIYMLDILYIFLSLFNSIIKDKFLIIYT